MGENVGKETREGLLASIRGRYEKITEGDLYKGLAVILVIAALSTVDSYVYAIGTSNEGGGLGLFAIAITFIVPIVSWSLFTLVVQSISVLLGGKGERRRFFAMCGFAYIPLVIQELLQIVIDLTNFSTLAQSPVTGQGLIGLFLNHFNLFKVLVLFLVVVAVMVNFNLNSKRAVMATLVPDVAVIILSLIFVSLNFGDGGGNIPVLGILRRRLLRR